jgi:hypothetical protein
LKAIIVNTYFARISGHFITQRTVWSKLLDENKVWCVGDQGNSVINVVERQIALPDCHFVLAYWNNFPEIQS